jgi:hypothetical protein
MPTAGAASAAGSSSGMYAKYGAYIAAAAMISRMNAVVNVPPRVR